MTPGALPSRHQPARFITFEGVDGAGKSTHIEWFAARLAETCAAEVVVTREPGGTAIGEALRAMVLNQPMHLETEALLMFASRRQLIVEVIEPALARDAWVVCDRFTDSTIAYQGGGRGVPEEKLEVLRQWVHPSLLPAKTILFDLAPEVARRRLDVARDRDRFEQEAGDFFGRVRAAYLRLAAAQPDRIVVLDGTESVTLIREKLEIIIAELCLE